MPLDESIIFCHALLPQERFIYKYTVYVQFWPPLGYVHILGALSGVPLASEILSPRLTVFEWEN